MPGSDIQDLLLTDAIRRHPDVELILTRHEQAAAYMASAHAKLTGEIGVCMSIAGPGATNLITGIVDAATDRAPVLALLAQTAGGSGFRVEEPEDLDEAFRKALSSSGPSVIDFKIDPDKYIEAIHRL